MDMSLSERLDYVHGDYNNVLIINDNCLLPAGSQLAMQSAEPAVFNRVFGPLLAATAAPDDRTFSTQVSISVEMVSVSANFSRHIRHIAAPHESRDPSAILLFARHGAVSLAVGGMLRPLGVAIVSSDMDFTIRPERSGETCTVGWIALASTPDLACQAPRLPVVTAPATEGPLSDSVERLRLLGEQIIESIPRSRSRTPGEGARDAGELGRLMREHLGGGIADNTLPDAPGVVIGLDGNSDIVARVQRFLRQHASDAELTPGRLARHCAVSVRKLYNAFAAADMSLRATVLSYRLEEARRQLHSRTVKKVTSIAYDTGFRDVSTFYRNFRREFGFSPRHNGDGGASETAETSVPLSGGAQIVQAAQAPIPLAAPHGLALPEASAFEKALYKRKIAQVGINQQGIDGTDANREPADGPKSHEWPRSEKASREAMGRDAASREKALSRLREPSDAMRASDHYDAHVESIRLPRSTLFRHHPPRSKSIKLPSPPQERQRRT